MVRADSHLIRQTNYHRTPCQTQWGGLQLQRINPSLLLKCESAHHYYGEKSHVFAEHTSNILHKYYMLIYWLKVLKGYLIL